MKKTRMMAFALAMAALSAVSISASAAGNEVYAGVGTTGITAGYARALTDHIGARVEANVLNYSGHLDDNDVRYDAKLKMNTFGAYVDYFPFSGFSLRVTGGAIFGDRKADLTANASSGTVTINHQQYPAAGQSVFGTVKLPSVAPYLGIGTGHNANNSGFSFITDLGVAIGKPSVSLSASPALLALAGQANVAAERNRLQDKVDKYNLYPVVRIAIGYAF